MPLLRSEPTPRRTQLEIEKRLTNLGLTLPSPPKAVANYSPWVLHDGVLYLSGVGGRSKIFGKLGGEVSIDEGYTLAREAALMHIAAMKEALGDLDRVERILHLVGYVSCTPDFADQPRVIDGATDIFAGLFGEAGLPARAAIGVMSLPFNIPVEIETMVAVRAG